MNPPKKYKNPFGVLNKIKYNNNNKNKLIIRVPIKIKK
jgi:hypothetical protein|tara:strand:+ start:116 stop:229 length:114 start_codon:yes stop_codon:yes gene_type:complete